MPNQGKVQQEDGHAFSTTDTKIRYRTENSGSPLEHAQVDSNFEILRNVANGLVDDIKSNYDDIRVNQASIASLESRADEFDNITSVNANDIAVNGVKIGENLEKIEALQETTASQGEDISSNADGIATNATAILNLNTETTDNHTALETRVASNETAIATLQGSDGTNTENITELQNNLSVTTAGAIANENNIATLDEVLSKTVASLDEFFGDTSELNLDIIDSQFADLAANDTLIAGRVDTIDTKLDTFFNSTDPSDGLTLSAITGAIDQNSLVTTELQQEVAVVTPLGVVTPYAGVTPPSGWILCDGRNLNTYTYRELHKALSNKYGGTAYSAGTTDQSNAASTFKIPDIRGRVVAGYGNKNRLTGSDSLGNTSGSQTHTLTTAQMPSHTHPFVDSFYSEGWGGGSQVGSNDTDYDNYDQTKNKTTSATGGGEAHNNVQPTIVLNYIIKAL